MANIITVDHLSFEYNEKTPVFKDLSMAVKAGEWLAVIGQNGSGKSTLAKLIDGLLEFDTGTITVGGLILNYENLAAIRDQIGIVFQNPDNQFVGATVEEDVAFGLENRQVPREQMVKLVEKNLKLVNMWNFKDRIPASLSGGQKQRVAIAGILAVEPQIIILDEATSMLDPLGRQDIIQLIRQLKAERNLTVISITHDINEAALADRVLLLNQGEVVEETTPAQIFEETDKLTHYGLDTPFVVQLAQRLRDQNILIPKQYMDEKELIQWLQTYNSTK